MILTNKKPPTLINWRACSPLVIHHIQYTICLALKFYNHPTALKVFQPSNFGNCLFRKIFHKYLKKKCKYITPNEEALSPDPSNEAFDTSNCFPLVLDINQTCPCTQTTFKNMCTTKFTFNSSKFSNNALVSIQFFASVSNSSPKSAKLKEYSVLMQKKREKWMNSCCTLLFTDNMARLALA